MTPVRTARAALLVATLVLAWIAGGATAHAAGAPSGPATSASKTFGSKQTASRTLGAAGATGSHIPTHSAVPTKQTPTSATNNKPGLIIGSAVVALGLIGGGAVVAGRRLADDAHE